MINDNVVTGTVEGTGAELIVLTGFVPRVVKMGNIDGGARLLWNDSMPDDSGVKMLPAMSFITTGGVSPYNEEREEMGFVLGADTDVNVSGETIYWEAYK